MPMTHLVHLYTLPVSGLEMNTDSHGVDLMIFLASAGYGCSQVTQHLLQLHLVFQPIWGWGKLGFLKLL
jgi:hypothetical protein